MFNDASLWRILNYLLSFFVHAYTRRSKRLRNWLFFDVSLSTGKLPDGQRHLTELPLPSRLHREKRMLLMFLKLINIATLLLKGKKWRQKMATLYSSFSPSSHHEPRHRRPRNQLVLYGSQWPGIVQAQKRVAWRHGQTMALQSYTSALSLNDPFPVLHLASMLAVNGLGGHSQP